VVLSPRKLHLWVLRLNPARVFYLFGLLNISFDGKQEQHTKQTIMSLKYPPAFQTKSVESVDEHKLCM
jgi:hypothetical protein